MEMTSQVMRRVLLNAFLKPGKEVERVEIQEITMAAGAEAQLHLHPCPALGVVIFGEIVFEIEQGPVRHLGPGDAFYEPAEVRVARFNNAGEVPARFVVFYLLGRDEKETIRILAE